MATWMVIKIGNREYAINSKYVVAVSDLKINQMLVDSKNKFVKGTYNIFNSNIPVIDGFKITREESKNETKMNFSKTMTNLKFRFEILFDAIDLEELTLNNSTEVIESDKLALDLFNEINKLNTDTGEIFLDKQMKKLVNAASINLTRISKIIMNRVEKKMGIIEFNDNLAQLKDEYSKYIVELIDNIIDYNNSRINESCIVFNVKGRIFGLSIDSIKFIVDTEIKYKLNRKTILSTGTIELNNEVYNIIDLTRIGNILN